MKRCGYTLSEVLITLGLIGVISALTIPSLVNEYNKQIYAKTLSVAVSDFEAAMKNMIQKEAKEDLLETAAWEKINSNGAYTLNNTTTTATTTITAFKDELNRYLPMTISNSSTTYSSLGVTKPGIATQEAYSVRFLTKKGVEYFIYVNGVSATTAPKTEAILIQGGFTYRKKAADVCIDVNGKEEPNILGRDMFCYELSVDGDLHALGGYEYLSYNGKQLPDVSSTNKNKKTIKDLCVDDKDSVYCAEYLKQNNYKMDY